jgi:thiol-disulfide isomerase/thioredoxin
MKKTVPIVIAVLAVIMVAAHYADKATRLHGGGASISRADSTKGGIPEPDVTLKDLDGKDVSLAQFKGKVLLVDFWATWCDPCRVEIPWLIEMQQKYSAKGFTVLGVALDEEGRKVVAPFVEKEQFDINGGKSLMNYPIVLGNDEVTEKFGGLVGYPTGFLISRDGKIVKKFLGLTSYDEIAHAVESQL